MDIEPGAGTVEGPPIEGLADGEVSPPVREPGATPEESGFRMVPPPGVVAPVSVLEPPMPGVLLGLDVLPPVDEPSPVAP